MPPRVTPFDDLTAAVTGADAVITMLPNGALVKQVWGQIAEAVTPGTVMIDSSTIDVDSAIAAHQMLTDKGCLTLDAPVSGGTGGAEAGTLTFMVGGTAQALAKGTPFLQPMAGRVVPCGGAGAGQAAKICNNMLLGISMIGAAEAFALGEKLGLEHQALFDVLSTSSGQCWSVNTYCPVPGPVPTSPANRDYQAGKNQNTLQEAHLQKILDAFTTRKKADKYAHVAGFEEITENDFNLNIPRYVDTFEEEAEIDIAAVEKDIEQLEVELVEVRAKMKQYLKELGV